jgi:hypothetical protein
MDWVFRGVYLIDDKKTGRITNVQVEGNIRGSRAASSRTPKRFRGRKT